MKVINFSKRYQASLRSDIERISIKLNVSLPDDYIEFCLKQGAGIVASTHSNYSVPRCFDDFYEEYTDPDVYFSYMHTLANTESVDDVLYWLQMIEFPSGVVPFAADMSGNFFVLGKINNEWRVLFWDSELEKGFVIADSFSDFIDGTNAEAFDS